MGVRYLLHGKCPILGDMPKFITIFKTSDSVEIANAKTLLDCADIPFNLIGETAQTLLGPGVGPVRFQVEPEYEEEALELLSEL